MFLDSPMPEDKQVTLAANNFTLLLPLTFLTILFGLYFAPLVQYTNHSLRFFIK
jgi:hypothetical protein